MPHVLDADRVRGAQRAIAEFDCQLIVLDDAFQHRRIHRDLDIVLIDALEPFGFGHVFPRGTLREPLAGWRRAQVAILTRSDLVDASQRAEIRRQFARYAPAAAWVEATYPPRALAGVDGHERDTAELTGRRVAAFCGIGNPAGFRHSLVQCGYDVVAMRELADHFSYPAGDVAALAQWVDSLEVASAVCTSKDLVKIDDRWPGNTPLCALVSRLQVVSGQGELEACLQRLVQARSAVTGIGRSGRGQLSCDACANQKLPCSCQRTSDPRICAGRCESIALQEGVEGRMELVITDDGSTDETPRDRATVRRKRAVSLSALRRTRTPRFNWPAAATKGFGPAAHRTCCFSTATACCRATMCGSTSSGASRAR